MLRLSKWPLLAGLILFVAASVVIARSEVVLDSELGKLPIVKKLSAIRQKAHPDTDSGLQQWVFSKLFPFNARWNSLLATFYISSFPNFILALVPADLDPTSLNTMISFATGGLLGDVCLHLIPHSFMGEASVEDGHGSVRLIVVDEKRNVVIGFAIFLGFFAFFLLDKTLRVLNADPSDTSPPASGHSHHGHSHSHASSNATSSAIEEKPKGELRKRGNGKGEIEVGAALEQAKDVVANEVKKVSSSLRLSAYLNLFGDFTHNITDGLAMAASFYASPQLGAISTVATFMHEIPHEIADYSILIKSGFTKRQAMGSQFLTAGGAFLGTILGILIAEGAGAGASTGSEAVDLAKVVIGRGDGFLGTSVGYADLMLPATAGGFLYIASVSVVPELLAESRSGKQAMKEYFFMMVGVLVMGVLAWNE